MVQSKFKDSTIYRFGKRDTLYQHDPYVLPNSKLIPVATGLRTQFMEIHKIWFILHILVI